MGRAIEPRKMVLEPIYEQDFLDCSYGYRPGRSPHQALEGFWQQMMKMGGDWVVEVDIKSFFDTLKAFAASELGREHGARIINYADDFVVARKGSLRPAEVPSAGGGAVVGLGSTHCGSAVNGVPVPSLSRTERSS